MNISINFTLNQEQSDALQERVDLHNSSSSTSITPSEFLKISELDFYIQTLVDQRYVASLTRLGTAASALPYEERQALITQIQAQLP